MPSKFNVKIHNYNKVALTKSLQKYNRKSLALYQSVSALILLSCVVKKKRSKPSQNSSFGYCFGHDDAFLALLLKQVNFF